LEQVQSDKQREPQEVRVDVDPQQDAHRHKTSGNHPQRTFDSHDALSYMYQGAGMNSTGRLTA
jgi:hypothetical protein